MPRRKRWELFKLKRAFEAAASIPQVLTGQPIGFWIMAMRSGLRITQQELSRRSGVPRAQISRIETGKVDPQISTVQRLFAAAGCKLVSMPLCRAPGPYGRYIRKTG